MILKIGSGTIINFTDGQFLRTKLSTSLEQFQQKTKIAEAFKEQAGVKLDPKPQIKMDPTRPFYSAMVIIKDTP